MPTRRYRKRGGNDSAAPVESATPAEPGMFGAINQKIDEFKQSAESIVPPGVKTIIEDTKKKTDEFTNTMKTGFERVGNTLSETVSGNPAPTNGGRRRRTKRRRAKRRTRR